MMTYTEAMVFKNLTKFGYNFGLDRITRLLELLDNPHQNLKVIHVGGTNGKGSTCAMVSSMLQLAGYRVGMFISPHLHSYTERMRIDGKDIPRETIARLLTRMRHLLEKMVQEGYEHPTEFEVNTALALQYFFEEKVDFAILEVGLGGLLIRPMWSIPWWRLSLTWVWIYGVFGKYFRGDYQDQGGITNPVSLVVTAPAYPGFCRSWKIFLGSKARLIKEGKKSVPPF